MVRLVLSVAVACAAEPPAPPAAAPVTATPVVPALPAPAAPVLATSGELAGSCEASALVRVGDRWIVGDNEAEALLFVYDAAWQPLPDEPLKPPVEDVEALALLDGRLVVVGSHSLNRKGKPRPDRHRILGLGPRPVELDAAPFGAALDIEGAVAWRGQVWLGLRGPVRGGVTTLVRVSTGADYGRIEQIVPLDLAGDGIRELTPWGEALLVVSGPVADSGRPFALWSLAAPDAAPVRLAATLPAGAEGAWVDGDRVVYVLDGKGEPGACETPSRWGSERLTPGPG